MNIDQAFPSKYLKAADLNGQAVVVSIADVVMVALDDGTKPLVTFVGKEKGLVLNITNANTIKDAYGPETAGWIGRRVRVYPSKTEYHGRMVDCLRVDVPGELTTMPVAQEALGQQAPVNQGGIGQQPTGEEPPPPGDDDIPF